MTTEPNAAPGLPASVLRSVRRLTQRRGRDLTGMFLAEGRQAVREALGSPGRVQEIIVDDAVRHADLLDGLELPVWQADEHQMRQLSDTVTPQGVVAVCRQLDFDWESLDGARLVVICAQVRDPGNAGTVIRCADAFGADAVILTSGSVEIYNPKTVRSTVGSIFHLPILTGVTLAEAVERVKGLGMTVLAADGEGDPLDLKAASGGLSGPIAWIMGNEAWGLPADDARLADEVVAVPMWGQAESLNLSSAAAVCLYATASAQRRETGKGSN
ncbi:TrmH family RNA methyltransferase [Tessaracoccus flavus]|uniref:rRNA methyltransferase n=1 Tax=Tessaracoccus flavus TaxID=1610493 RepID=A0A1Q2CFB1_9ACTN|nr:RNA methyltransferase [Tessaracoccus flavus]AQP44793.1 rRNA methyltransferase [Tessaracoccus flavus]SDZ19448.1 RNA methyltransferase, TrmH family [Tessaracoccus flavus]